MLNKIEEDINGKEVEELVKKYWPLQVFMVVKCVGIDIDLSSSLFPNLGKINRS